MEIFKKLPQEIKEIIKDIVHKEYFEKHSKIVDKCIKHIPDYEIVIRKAIIIKNKKIEFKPSTIKLVEKYIINKYNTKNKNKNFYYKINIINNIIYLLIIN